MTERNAALSRRDFLKKVGKFTTTMGIIPYLPIFPPEPPLPPMPEIRPVENIAPISKLLEHGSRDRKDIALTFDACMTEWMRRHSFSPDNWHNDKIIQILNDTQTPATFYICGLYAEMVPDFVRSLASNPLFTIGNHSYDHLAFRNPSFCYGLASITTKEEKIAEIQKAQDSLTKIAGVTPIDFRFPGNCYTDYDIDLAYNLGLTSVAIEVVGEDGFNNDPDMIIRKVLRDTQPGSIIGLHVLGRPNAPVTDKALGPIISGLRDKKFNFVTIQQLGNLH